MKIFDCFLFKIKKIVLIGLLLLMASSVDADERSENIENTRTVLEKWVETQKIISKEKKDFAISREMLNERIELVGREIESLQEKISQAKESIAEADKKRAEMLGENEKLKQASESLSGDLASLENRTKMLLANLPDPITQRIKPLSQRLPESPEEAKDAKLSASQRFQNVVGILNEVDKFNREITVTSEVRELEDGSSVEVTALYVGISQGFFANADGTIAGVGTSMDDKWTWRTHKESAPQISDIISIMKNEKAASFVQVPVEIK